MAICEINEPISTPGSNELRDMTAPECHLEVTKLFIACGGCPSPIACFFKGGCELGKPTGLPYSSASLSTRAAEEASQQTDIR